MNPDKIGKFINKLRTEKGLSQYQLADKIPISRQAVSKWERGITIPDSTTLLKLSDIFNVTINELLKGERVKDNSIKQLEKTTLNILDESNRKSRKMKKIVTLFITIITLLTFSFLFYYFINSYNTIKVYAINSENEKFSIFDGIYITTNQQSYFKIGKIVTDEDITINKMQLFYKKEKQKIMIAEDIDIDRIITDFSGYSRILSNKGFNDFINNTFIEITYNETEKDILKLEFKRKFSNNRLWFNKEKEYKEDITTSINDMKIKLSKKEEDLEEEKEITEEDVPKELSKDDAKSEKKEEIPVVAEELPTKEMETVDENAKIEIIHQKGIKNMINYIYEAEAEGSKITFMYYEKINQLIMSENNEVVWTYLRIPKIYNCEKFPDKFKDTSDEDSCKKYINYCLNTYVN